MKIFLTGGTGFVGSHFINKAHSVGHEIIALRRPGSETRIRLEKQPTWIEGSLDDDWSVQMIGCEVFVHFAAHSANTPYDTLSNCNYWNVYVSTKLAEQAIKSKIRKFLVAGSCFEYGSSAARYEKIPPNAPLEPTLSYPISKAAASISFAGLSAENDLYVKILRLFQVYGEGEQETRLWPSMRKAALEGLDFNMSPGEQIRDFIDVVDASAVFVEELDFTNNSSGKALIKNVGSGVSISLRDFSEKWWKQWGAKGTIFFGSLPYRKNEIMRLVPEL